MIIYYKMFTLAMAINTYKAGTAVPCDGDSKAVRTEEESE